MAASNPVTGCHGALRCPRPSGPCQPSSPARNPARVAQGNRIAFDIGERTMANIEPPPQRLSGRAPHGLRPRCRVYRGAAGEILSAGSLRFGRAILSNSFVGSPVAARIPGGPLTSNSDARHCNRARPWVSL